MDNVKKWKIDRMLSYAVAPPSDWIEHKTYTVDPEIEQHVIDYFTVPVETLVYPAKSYAVAIIYALLLNKYYGEDVHETLIDRDLLPDDQFYTPYHLAHTTYNFLLDYVVLHSLVDVESIDLPQVMETVRCFHNEFSTRPAAT